MSKIEAIVRELDELPEQDLDALLAFVNSLKSDHREDRANLIAAESSLAKDWLTSEEDAAWANL